MRVIIAGAGPGGASAAIALARAGATVELFERSAWPRAKTCGDGVSPAAIETLRELGVAVPPALELRRALVHTPSGTAFRGGWPAATPFGTIIERRAFDALLVDAAIAAGATFFPATEVRSIANATDGVTVGVRADARDRVVRADAAIVADGAGGALAKHLGFPAHRSRVIALRAYAASRVALTAEYGLFYDRGLSPGYGWIFPLTSDRANVGICVDERALARAGGDMRTLLRHWLGENRIARECIDVAAGLTDVRGGIIPSGRRRRANGRVLLIGDAAGVADPFTAEGIFEAIESGRLAAAALTATGDVHAAAATYEGALAGLDRNERAARALRATFNLSIEPYARFAALRPRFADRLMTGVFFAKPEFPALLWNLHAGH